MNQYLAAYKPEFKLVFDHPPPIGTKLIFRGLNSGSCIGEWNPEAGFVAWMELPKFSPETRRQLDAIVASGLDPTKYQGGIT